MHVNVYCNGIMGSYVHVILHVCHGKVENSTHQKWYIIYKVFTSDTILPGVS